MNPEPKQNGTGIKPLRLNGYLRNPTCVDAYTALPARYRMLILEDALLFAIRNPAFLRTWIHRIDSPMAKKLLAELSTAPDDLFAQGDGTGMDEHSDEAPQLDDGLVGAFLGKSA